MSHLPGPGTVYLNLAVLILATILDAVMPEPPARLHPVVWMGKLISLLIGDSPAPGTVRPLLAGMGIALLVPGLFGAAVWTLSAALWTIGPIAYVLGGAALLRTTFTVAGLGRAAKHTAANLEAGDIRQARSSLRSLVSRRTEGLSPSHIAGAAVESVAENTTDGFIGPWLAFALLGLPGTLVYRAVNTLDCMIGYRGRYEYLGKASARLDDAINLVPARLSGLLLLGAGALSGYSARSDWRRMRQDHGKVASPNAGWTMSAMAGLLGVTLSEEGHYRLGEGLREPNPQDVRAAVSLCQTAAVMGLAVVNGATLARWKLSR